MQIRVQELSKRFGSRLILDRIALKVDAGETVALIGPSGGGKSTLLRCLNGLATFDSGEIRVGDHVLRAANVSERKWSNGGSVQQMRRIFGMVFQDFQLFPHLTALGNVIEAPSRVLGLARKEARERGHALLKRVGLADHANAYPQQLSGGQKQRVAIARALAMEPRGLLCDEITSALDPEIKNEVLSVLEDLKRDGMTILMVTHEIGFARRAADRVVVLAEGRLIADGPPDRVIDHSENERVRSFLRRVLG